MDTFKINYYLHPPYISDMTNLSLNDLRREFTSIYGQFTFAIADYNFTVFMDKGTMPDDIRPTELIDSHLDLLIAVIKKLNESGIAYMHYIENDWTWVRFEVNEDGLVTVYELNRKHDYLKDGNSFNPDKVTSEYFNEAEIKYGPYLIALDQLVEEINETIIKFVEELSDINKDILKLKCISRIIEYYHLITR